MGKCKFSIDFNTFCSVCGCDSTPGFEINCNNKICECQIDPQKNIILAKENNTIFTIAENCRAHYSLRSDYTDIRKYMIITGKVKMTQEMIIPNRLLNIIKECKWCGKEFKKYTFIYY